MVGGHSRTCQVPDHFRKRDYSHFLGKNLPRNAGAEHNMQKVTDCREEEFRNNATSMTGLAPSLSGDRENNTGKGDAVKRNLMGLRQGF